jgi:peptidoglycan/xylan/chitin deacetylase (PgdA/CDA1 family)
MSMKTRLAAPILHISGGSAVLARRQRVGRILMFHGIDEGHYPAALLEANLAYLSRHFKIVPLAVMVEQLSEPDAHASIPGEIVITFDDGLRNNFTRAYPVLRRLGVPATFFVCPGLIEEHRWQWTHEVVERLGSLGEKQRAEIAADVEAPTASAEGLKQWMKALPVHRREVVEDCVRARTRHFAPTEAQRRRFDPITWDELRRLDPRLVTVGSHTLTHPMLDTVTAAAAELEIRESRRWLERELDREVAHFCYPDGAHDESIVRLVREHYRSAVTTVPGFVRAGDNLHRLQRIPAAEQPFLLAWRLHQPQA